MRNERVTRRAPSARCASEDVRDDGNTCSQATVVTGRTRYEHVYGWATTAEIGFAERNSGVAPCKRSCSRIPWQRAELRHPRQAGAGPSAANLTNEMAVTLAERRTYRPILGRRRRAKTMEKFVIEGGVPLSGTMVPAGNKNGALPILASSLLTEDEVVVRNVPRIRDVEAMLSILRAIGVDVSWRGANDVALCAAAVHSVEIEPELAELIRASFLLAGPLLARFHRAVMPPPGGDVIGRRRLDPHLDAFRAMGAIADCDGEIVLSAPRGLRPTDVFMDEPSVMATENALMAAALTPGTTVIGNAACEPHVQDLARMLVKMGAD